MAVKTEVERDSFRTTSFSTLITLIKPCLLLTTFCLSTQLDITHDVRAVRQQVR